MRLRRKIHLYSSVLFAILIIAASVTVYYTISRLSIQHELEQIKLETLQSTTAIRQWSELAAMEELLRAYVPINGMIALVHAGNEPPIIVTSSTETQLGEIQLTFSEQEQMKRIKLDGQSYGFISVPFIGADGQIANVQSMVNLSDLLQLLDILRIVLMIVVIGVMIPALFSSGVLGSLIMQPISEMTQTIKEISRSGKFVRLKQADQSNDELAEMGQAFNEMIALLENNFAKQEQFLSNASHELKTPLTIIESYASLLKRRGRDKPELFEESVEAIHSEAQRMKALTEQLLLLAKPNKQWTVHFKEIDLIPFVQRTITNFQKAYDRDIHLQTHTLKQNEMHSEANTETHHVTNADADPRTGSQMGTQNEAQMDVDASTDTQIQTDLDAQIDVHMNPQIDSPMDFDSPMDAQYDTHMDTRIKAYTDEEMLSQLLIIFLDNARKYSEEPITVEIESSEKHTIIRVLDRGIGIPKEELDRVFERFYRVDKARGRHAHDDEGGSGLGLSLAKEIADVAGIEIDLESVERLGTTVTMRLPKQKRH